MADRSNDEEDTNTEADSDSEDMDISLACLAIMQKDIHTDQYADVETVTNEADTNSDVEMCTKFTKHAALSVKTGPGIPFPSYIVYVVTMYRLL